MLDAPSRIVLSPLHLEFSKHLPSHNCLFPSLRQVSTVINRSFPRRTFASRSSEALARSVGSGNFPHAPPPLRKSCLWRFLSVHSFNPFYLVRPTTFWRKTRRSGVTAASYSPSFAAPFYCCRTRLWLTYARPQC